MHTCSVQAYRQSDRLLGFSRGRTAREIKKITVFFFKFSYVNGVWCENNENSWIKISLATDINLFGFFYNRVDDVTPQTLTDMRVVKFPRVNCLLLLRNNKRKSNDQLPIIFTNNHQIPNNWRFSVFQLRLCMYTISIKNPRLLIIFKFPARIS